MIKTNGKKQNLDEGEIYSKRGPIQPRHKDEEFTSRKIYVIMIQIALCKTIKKSCPKHDGHVLPSHPGLTGLI